MIRLCREGPGLKRIAIGFVSGASTHVVGAPLLLPPPDAMWDAGDKIVDKIKVSRLFSAVSRILFTDVRDGNAGSLEKRANAGPSTPL
jgi:hypothetical protein